jgi:IS30 family transposase
MGKRMTAIGTLVERATRYVMLFRLPDGNTAESVRTALAEMIQRLPEHLWRSLTWDRGKEMAEHARFTSTPERRCISVIPSRPGSADRMRTPTDCCVSYFPKGTDMGALNQKDLDQATYSLNTWPRQPSDGRHHHTNSPKRCNDPVRSQHILGGAVVSS